MNSVAALYDHLFSFESGKFPIPYPVHKSIRIIEGKLLDFIESKVNFDKNDFLLDAGCGNGFTLFQLNSKYGCSGLGVSLSQKEIEFANQFANHKDVKNLSFKCDSYDSRFTSKFNKIIAIESLKHSENLDITIGNLMKNLVNGGKMIVSDDFIVNKTKNLSRQAALWHSNSFVSKAIFLEIINKHKGELVGNYDLTSNVPIRPRFVLYILNSLTVISISILKWFSSTLNLNTYRGGLLLELAYSKLNINYNVLIIQKNGGVSERW